MSRDHNTDKVTFGFWVYLMSDCVLFAGLFATYAVLHTQTFGAISASDIVDLPYVLLETLLLLASSFTVGLALLFAYKGKVQAALLWLFVTLILGLGFLALELNEFAHLIGEGAGPTESAFLSSFFTLLGTHGLHVFLGSIWIIILMAHIFLKGLSTGAIRKLVCLALFWHFLDIIWIFIFTFIYLSPLYGALALVALLQLCVQIYFLFYMEKRSLLDLVSLGFALGVVAILIGGTLWIMHNLSHGQAEGVPFIENTIRPEFSND